MDTRMSDISEVDTPDLLEIVEDDETKFAQITRRLYDWIVDVELYLVETFGRAYIILFLIALCMFFVLCFCFLLKYHRRTKERKGYEDFSKDSSLFIDLYASKSSIDTAATTVV